MDNFNLKKYLAEGKLLKEEKVFSVSFTNEFEDEELVVYVKGVDNEKEALNNIRDSYEYQTNYNEWGNHLVTYDLGEFVELDDMEQEQFEGDLAFFDIEPLSENKLVKENKMKKSELKKIIKEEIKSALKEDDFEEDEFVDLDAIEKTLRDAYRSHNFLEKDPSEFEEYLDDYLDSVSSYGDKEAYDNLSSSDLIQDFVDYVSYSE